MKTWFCARPSRVLYEIADDPHFSMKPFKFRSEKIDFSSKDSVELKIRFLSILRRFQIY